MYYALLCAALLVVYVLKRVLVIVKAQITYDKRLPRLITTTPPLSAFGAFFPTSSFHLGLDFVWQKRRSLYKGANLKMVAVIPAVWGNDALYSASLPVFHQVLGLNAPFEKPDMGVLEILGENVVTAGGEIWKRHRRITAPAFNHATYRNVWETTARVYQDMLKQEGWLHVDVTPLTEFNRITHKLALFLISIVGFNIPMTWSEPPRDERGNLSVQSIFFRVASSIIERSQLPRWAYLLGFKRLTDIEEAFNTFEAFMHERIAEREAGLKKVRALDGANKEAIAGSIKDVFGLLVNARLSDSKLSLSDEEIIGNCFIFTFAGHETTANTLAAALCLLAANPEKQEWVYNSIKSVIGDRTPTFDDFDDLSGVLACFYEALRMYPAAYVMSRVASKDLTLSIPRQDNPAIIEQVPIKRGTGVNLNLVAISYDPQNFPEPESFKPERWVSSGKFGGASHATSITRDTEAGEVSASSPASSLEGFVGFSFGPRTCLGHKFAKVEGVAFLTHLLNEWRIEPALRNGETNESWKERVLVPSLKLTLTVKDVTLKLARRSSPVSA